MSDFMQRDEPSMNQKLLDFVEALRTTTREGSDVDQPEGSRFIRISDTLAREMADVIEGVIDYDAL